VVGEPLDETRRWVQCLLTCASWIPFESGLDVLVAAARVTCLFPFSDCRSSEFLGNLSKRLRAAFPWGFEISVRTLLPCTPVHQRISFARLNLGRKPLGLCASPQLGLEGVIGKRKGSRYESGKRTGSWIKYRINRGQELVIGGYFPGPDLMGNLHGVSLLASIAGRGCQGSSELCDDR
jgi:hypothetical protein